MTHGIDHVEWARGAETAMLARRRPRRPGGSPAETPEKPLAPTYRPSAYTVFPSGYDEIDDPDRTRWCLTVADAGDGWVIRRGDHCLNISNRWQREQSPEIRDAEFRRMCLYNEHAAILRARRVVDRLEIGGLTFEEFVWQVKAGASDVAAGHGAYAYGGPLVAPRIVIRTEPAHQPSVPGGLP